MTMRQFNHRIDNRHGSITKIDIYDDEYESLVILFYLR